MSVAWLMLTWNRLSTVTRCLNFNLENSGSQFDEFIHVDNGSSEPVVEAVSKILKPTTQVVFEKNQGVAKGYNAAMALARSDWLVITGCDCLMPDGWLKTFKDHVESIPNTGCACMYLQELSQTNERWRGEIEVLNGRTIRKAIPIGRRFFRRELLEHAGFLMERLGLYGWEDVLWCNPVERACKEKGWINYHIVGQTPNQTLHEGPIGEFSNYEEYAKWKSEEVKDKTKHEVIAEYVRLGCPAYFPFGG